MNAPNKPGAIKKIAKVVLWRSPRGGRWVVVQGPFPEMARSETRDKMESAAKQWTDNVYLRPATTREDQFAKVRLTDIIEIESGHNDFGPVVP